MPRRVTGTDPDDQAVLHEDPSAPMHGVLVVTRDDGGVRQHFEISQDGGATWATWFDGRYVGQRP